MCDLCPMLKAATSISDGSTKRTLREGDDLMMLGIGESGIKVTVLVNVGKFTDSAQGIHQIPASVIGLNTLDECKRSFRNVRHLFMETVVNMAIGRRVKPEREAASLVPSLGQGSSDMVALNEIESQIVERGPQLIDDLSRDNRNVWRRLPKDLELIFAVRVRDDAVRLTFNVGPDDVLEQVQVLFSPAEFQVGGFKSGADAVSLADISRSATRTAQRSMAACPGCA
jgi:hypothetical protein